MTLKGFQVYKLPTCTQLACSHKPETQKPGIDSSSSSSPQMFVVGVAPVVASYVTFGFDMHVALRAPSCHIFFFIFYFLNKRLLF